MEQDKDPLLGLLSRIQNREESAMGELYDNAVTRVYGLALKIVLKHELAEEVVGDVFLQVWNKADNFDASKAAPLAWILMICRSRALDKLRRERPLLNNNTFELNENQAENNTSETPLSKIEYFEASGRVHEALQHLTEKQRLTIILAFYKDMTQSEISEYTGDPIGTVKSNVRRAQTILRQILSIDDLPNGGTYEKA